MLIIVIVCYVWDNLRHWDVQFFSDLSGLESGCGKLPDALYAHLHQSAEIGEHVEILDFLECSVS